MASDGSNNSATASPAAASTNASSSNNATSSPSNGAKPGNGATPNGAAAGDVRGQSAVSVAKGPVSAAKGAHSINFGSVHDQNAMLSSSPAAQPSSGHQPAKFGSLTAASGEGGKKVVGFPGKGGDASEGGGSHSLKRSMDFNKLFQGGGSNSPSATPSSTSATAAPAAATATTANGSNAANTSVDASSAGRNPPSNLRPPSGQNRPFEQAQRSPSSSHHQNASARNPSNPASGPTASSPYHHGGAQQPRSPPLAQSGTMQPYPSMGGAPPQWQQHQHPQPMPYFQPGYPGYGYPPGTHHPQQMHQQWHAQAGYDMTGQMQPRSPRHMAASPMGAPNQNGMGHNTPSMSSATPGLSSPASQRSQPAMPHTPSSQAGSVPSPQNAAAYSMGMGRPSGFAGQGSHFATHSPSHSFSSASGGPQMSPTARNFEFGKRTSSAIRIVNPETKATVDPRAAGEHSATPPPPAASSGQSTAGTPTAASSTGAQGTPTPAHPSPAASPAPVAKQAAASPAKRPDSSAKLETPDSFMARVKAAAAENKRKKEAAEEEERAAATKKVEDAKKAAEQEEEARKQKAQAEEEAAKKKQEEEEKAQREKEEDERKAKEAEEKAAKEKAESEAQAKAKAEAEEAEAARRKQEEADAEARKANEEAVKKEKADAAASAASSAASAAEPSSDKDKKRPPAPIDTSKASSSSDEDAGAKAVPSVSTPSTFRNSAADVERMAREASSVPSTPLDAGSARLPPVPSTPRTPGTPGFANLPAKPMSSLTPSASAPSGVTSAAAAAAGANNGIKLDSEALERRKRSTPSQLDVTAANTRPTSDAPLSAQSTALGSARFIDDLKQVQYPDKIQSPKPELNESAEPGKFRYDRDFLLQFMGVYKDKPMDLPSLSSIGMDSSQAAGARGMPGRRASGMGPPSAPGRPGAGGIGLGLGAGGAFGGAKGMGAGGMGSFSHPPKTSEERFAASNARGGGAFGSSGPMGSFNAGARSQPLSRTGSGSNALPSRDIMGSSMPAGGRTKSNRGRQREANSRGPHVNPPEKGGPTIPMDQVAPLAMSENRWQGSRGQNLKSDSPEMVNRKVKSLLNKLTVEKFDSISDQIIEWANKSVNESDGQTLRQVIALIFEKATDEAQWSEMYARLCRKIMEKLDPNIQDENIKTSDDKPVTGGQLFRKYLINRCQEDYERGWAQKDAAAAAAKSKEAEDRAKLELNEKQTADAKEAEARGEKPADKEAELMSDEYYEAQKAKRRGLGLVRFIGELFKLLMITEKIMHICIQRLLANAQDPEEEEIESLCKLLSTIGKQLDTGKNQSYVDIYFQRMKEMNIEAMNSRMRFMLQDVIELRQQKWKPRHDNAAPKTIAQIHEDAAKAKAEAEAEQYARQSGRGMGGPVSRGGSRRGQQRGDYGGAVGVDGWSTVGGNQPPPPPRQAKAGDLSGFGKGIDRSSTAGKPFAVGPQSVFAKKNQRGSEDGSNPPSRTNSTTNMFSLLNQQSGNEGGDGAAGQAADDGASARPKLNLAPRTKPLPESSAADDKKAEGEEDAKLESGAEADEADISDEEAKRKITNDVKEFLEIKDISEGRMALESLPSKRRHEFLSSIADVALNKHEDEVRLVGELLASSRKEGLLVDEMVEQGFKDQVEFLDDVSIDVPNAYSYMAILLVQSGLPREKIDTLAKTIQGEGLKPPSERLMQKVDEELAQ